MADRVISRAEARAQGLKRYFTGELCANGHIAERKVAGRQCVKCDLERGRRWYKLNHEKALEIDRRWKAANRDLMLARLRKRNTETGPYRDAMLARRAAWRDANKEKLAAEQKARRDANREEHNERARQYYYKNREVNIARAKRWKKENPEKRKEWLERVGYQQRKEWEAENKEKLKEYQKRYRTENKDAKYASINKRRALKKGSAGQYTAEDAKAILLAQGNKCANCKADLRKVPRHIDHIIPLSKRGTNDKTNIQWLCQTCNLKKKDKDPIQFAQEQGRLL